MATFNVTNTNDSGAGSLRQAILDAEAAAGADVITFTGSTFTDSNPDTIRFLSSIFISSDITIQGTGTSSLIFSGDANGSGINDNGDVRLFFINQGNVSFNSLSLAGGRGKGGNGGSSTSFGSGGGGGAGIGGALFINNGTVTVDQVAFSNNQAIGGNGGDGGSGISEGSSGGGGGGLVGNGGTGGLSASVGSAIAGGGGGGGGGLVGNGANGVDAASPTTVGAGGNGGSGFSNGGSGGGFDGAAGQNAALGSGGGGGGAAGKTTQNAGLGGAGDDFGGGGGTGGRTINGGNGGNGGFGGGGGGSIFGSSGGVGGFGGGGSGNNRSGGTFGGSGTFSGGGGGAGLGGAVFIRSGSLTLRNSTFSNNAAVSGVGGAGGLAPGQSGQSKAGAIFVNAGATVIAVGSLPTFADSAAADAGSSPIDNVNFYGAIVTAPAITLINRADPDLGNAAIVNYTVIFSEAVTGVDATDFSLSTTGITGTSIGSVASVANNVYTVSVNTGSGGGTLKLNLVDDDSIRNSFNLPLGSTGIGNGNFDGQSYTFTRTTLINGTNGADNLVGTGVNETLVGGLGRDTLTGGGGGDRFLFTGGSQRAALAASLLQAPDQVTDFQFTEGDRFQLDFDNNLLTANLPRGLFNAGRVRAASLGDAVRAAYADKNQSRAGKQALRANEALFFKLGSRTYLSVNDRQAGFSARTDLVADVTRIQLKSGDARAGVLQVADYFI